MAAFQTLLQIKNETIKKMRQESEGAAPRIMIHTGTCGYAAGAGRLIDVARKYAESFSCKVDISISGCLGLCASEPNVTVMLKGKPAVIYQKMTAAGISGIFERHIGKGLPVHEFLLAFRHEDASGFPVFENLGFFKKQVFLP